MTTGRAALCAGLLLALLAGAAKPAPAAAEHPFEWSVRPGYEVSPARTDFRGWPTFSLGVGRAFTPSASWELSVDYHAIGAVKAVLPSDAYLGSFDSFLGQRQLATASAGVLITSRDLGDLAPYVGVAVGAYAVRLRSDAPGPATSIDVRPGMSFAAGLKGRAGTWAPRLDLRVHFCRVDSENVSLSDEFAGGLVGLYQASLGVQFP